MPSFLPKPSPAMPRAQPSKSNTRAAALDTMTPFRQGRNGQARRQLSAGNCLRAARFSLLTPRPARPLARMPGLTSYLLSPGGNAGTTTTTTTTGTPSTATTRKRSTAVTASARNSTRLRRHFADITAQLQNVADENLPPSDVKVDDDNLDKRTPRRRRAANMESVEEEPVHASDEQIDGDVRMLGDETLPDIMQMEEDGIDAVFGEEHILETVDTLQVETAAAEDPLDQHEEAEELVAVPRPSSVLRDRASMEEEEQAEQNQALTAAMKLQTTQHQRVASPLKRASSHLRTGTPRSSSVSSVRSTATTTAGRRHSQATYRLRRTVAALAVIVALVYYAYSSWFTVPVGKAATAVPPSATAAKVKPVRAPPVPPQADPAAERRLMEKIASLEATIHTLSASKSDIQSTLEKHASSHVAIHDEFAGMIHECRNKWRVHAVKFTL